MIVTKNITEIRKIRWHDPTLTWGLVPTMGYLHEGHLSLARRARTENDRVIATIFVNPTQFAPSEDLATYPRDLEHDLALLEAEQVDMVFTPSSEIMYPEHFQTYITVENISHALEGKSRPTHFRGVTTVVAKLFNITQPTRAYFGQKDAQQAVVIKRMVTDLNMNIEIVVCPIIRELDGLAMSSRNIYLNANERKSATILYRSLTAAKLAIESGERDGDKLRHLMQTMIEAELLAKLDYVSVAHPKLLTELSTITDHALLSMSVFIGKTRLLDNMLISCHLQ